MEIECLIDFHQEEKFSNNFPRVRKALAITHQSAQALGLEVVMFQEHQRIPVPEPALESLVIQVQAVSGERSVSTVHQKLVPEELIPRIRRVGSKPVSDRWCRIACRIMRRYMNFQLKCCLIEAHELDVP